MARPVRIYYSNCVYHVCIRGNNKQPILLAPEDKVIFLKCLQKFKERFEFRLFGFVVMDNHVHLVIGAGNRINISKIMQAITLSYSVSFRKRYPYSGYVWQGRFRSNIIEDERYILSCVEYVHNNPVRAGLVNSAADYPWSSWKAYNSEPSNLEELVFVDKVEAQLEAGTVPL